MSNAALTDCKPTEIVATSTAIIFNSAKVNVIALAYVTAEAAASVATSASSKDCLEDVCIVAIVAELELGQVERR